MDLLAADPTGPAPLRPAPSRPAPTRPEPSHPEPTQRIHAATQRVRAFDARHPWVWDVALALVVALPGFLEVLAGGLWTGEARPAAVPALVLAGLVVPLVWRRRRPFAVLCVIQAVMLVHDLYHMGLASVVAIGIALYGVVLRLPLSRLGWAAAVIAAEITVKSVYRPPASFAADIVPTLAVVAAIVATAIAVRTRRAYVASLEERAHRLEIERDQKARLAAAAERARIAREMHDIIAHNLAVIVGLADGGAYAAQRDPRRPPQALRAISDTGRHALGELRRLLGVLRDDAPAVLTPQPGLADLDALLSRVRAAGLPVRHTVTGAVHTLSEGRQLAVYRIIQEALTNALKHAGPTASATVGLTHAPSGALDLSITNTGAPPPPTPSPAGQGLTGMQERSALYDGTLDAGPTAGGWEVRAHFPAAGPDGGPLRTNGAGGVPAGGVPAGGVPAGGVGAEPVGAGPVGAGPVGVDSVGTGPDGAGAGGAGPVGAGAGGGAAGGAGAGGTGATSAGAAGGAATSPSATETAATGPGSARTEPAGIEAVGERPAGRDGRAQPDRSPVHPPGPTASAQRHSQAEPVPRPAQRNSQAQPHPGGPQRPAAAREATRTPPAGGGPA